MSTRTLRDYFASLPNGSDATFVSPGLKKVGTDVFANRSEVDAAIAASDNAANLANTAIGLAGTAVQSIIAGSNITINNTDPQRPIISTTGGGAVTSVGLSAPTGFSVSGSPVTGSGTLALSYDTGYQAYTSAEAGKLAGIATGATANQTDSYLLNRANHTGSQLASTISNFSTAADARIAAAVGVSVQAYDADLAAIAALAPTNGNVITGNGTTWVSQPPASSGGQRTFTATGTLPNGATVVLNSDGTVSTVTSNNDTTGTATVFRSATTTYIASAALSATQVVVCYYDGTNAQAVIGTISGTSVSFGTAVNISAGSGTVSYISVAALSATSFAVAFYSSTLGNAYGVVGSVSGTTITVGSRTAFNPAATAFISIAALSSTAVVIAYQDTGNSSFGTAIIGTISGTTITFGSEYVFRGVVVTAISVAALSATQFVVSMSDGTNGQVSAGSVSGSSISTGTAANFDAGNVPAYTSIVALTSTTFMVAWARGTTDGRAKIGTVSGTAVSFPGSDAVFNAAATYYVSASKLSNTQISVVYLDNGNSNYGTVCIATVSGNTIAFGNEIVFKSSTSNYTTVAALNSSYVFVGFSDAGNSQYGTGVVFQPAGSNVANWIGITAQSIANGASGTVTILGGANTSLSGLTTGATYYLANDGSLTTTQTSTKAGRALSATSLLITGAAQ